MCEPLFKGIAQKLSECIFPLSCQWFIAVYPTLTGVVGVGGGVGGAEYA